MNPRVADLSLTSRPPATGPYVITGLTIVTGTGAVFSDGAIVIEGEMLAAVGATTAVLATHGHLTKLDGRGFTVMPGLVNAHTHAAMGFFRGLGHGHDNMIESFLFPAEKSLTPELIEPLAYGYLYDGLRSGVTTFGDHYYFVSGVARAADRLGVRAVVGETVADLGGAFPGLAGWNNFKATLDAWPHSSRVTPAVAPHAADTVSEALLQELAAFAKANDLPLHMHLSQTAGERQRVLARTGMSPVAAAEKAKALGPKTLAVHLVSIDDDDVKRLAASGATAGICPASQIVYEHLAPIAKITAANIPVALGTDCAASNDGADMMSEMKLYTLLARDRRCVDAACTPLAALNAGSYNGARALGLGTSLGTLEVGKAADIVFLENDLGTTPAANPDVNLIYSFNSRHIRHVMVAGRFALLGGRLAQTSEADLTAAYATSLQEINRRLGR